VAGTKQPDFPEDISLKYATVMSLIGQANKVENVLNALRWLIEKASPEWVQLFATDAFPLLRERNLMEGVQTLIMKEDKLKAFLVSYARLMAA
jgi:hypothetical protein